MKHQIKNYGFQIPKIDDTQYLFGSATDVVPRIIIQPDGQYVKCLPVFEKQFGDGFDTFGCTVYGTLSAVEILKKKTLPPEENYADRYLYIASEIQPPGADPHDVAEVLKKRGLVTENLLPFSPKIKSLNEYRSLEGKELILSKIANEWLKKYTFRHIWVFNTNIPLKNKQELLMENLMYGTIGISVRAWQQRENGLYYKDIGETDSHWCVLVGYEKNKHWIIYDSYPNAEGGALKYLEWDYDFGFAKRYYLAVNDAPEEVYLPIKGNLWQFIRDFVKKYLI